MPPTEPAATTAPPAGPPAAMRVRSFEFRAETAVGDGRTLEGYAAVFNTVQRIQGFFEDWDEQIARGAFERSLAERKPVMQFDHGRDARTGSVPIGSISDVHEDRKGLFVRARLFDNAVVAPIADAIGGGAITGMSIRFHVIDEEVKRREGEVELRTIKETDLHELGPVVFPAYDATTVGVRSLIAGLDPDEHRALLRELAEELGVAVPNLAGRSAARSADGSDSQRLLAASIQAARIRHRTLQTKGIL